MLNYNKLDKVRKAFHAEIYSNPEGAFEFFLTQWKALTFEEKRTISPEIINITSKILSTDWSFHPQGNNDRFYEKRMAATQVTNFLIDEANENPYKGTLKLGKTIDAIDIALVFRLLYDFKYVDNDLGQIEDVIKTTFDLPDNTTINSYLNDTAKLIKAHAEFKKLVATSKLQKE